MTQFIFVIAAVFSILLWRMYRHHHRMVMQARSDLLSQSSKVINIKKSVADRAGFQHLLGDYDGTTVGLKLEVDNLTARKLPVMWLHITMLRPENSSGSLDILVRPQTGDVFSPGWNWNKPITQKLAATCPLCQSGQQYYRLSTVMYARFLPISGPRSY